MTPRAARASERAAEFYGYGFGYYLKKSKRRERGLTMKHGTSCGQERKEEG
ncbi:hypothetical protein I79_005322 [Cricetulus griseus]|uniref:Uncharacterized protein n=1 Tax=Cricetulus griseus TaxID=10029 RepID=G3H4V9_CRIGR|nr:hypothetical protein I79_005322 [Cricetulus griseus]